MDRLLLAFISALFFFSGAKKTIAQELLNPASDKPREAAISLEETTRNPFLTREEEATLFETAKTAIINYLAASAIFYSPGGKSRAIIAGRILEEGSSIDNKEVIAIQPEAVVLKDAQTEYIVKLKE